MRQLFDLLMIACCLCLFSCRSNYNGNVIYDERYCDSCNEVSALLYERFYFTNDSSYLDSSLSVVNKALQVCPKTDNTVTLSLRKISLLSKKREFEQALAFLDSIDLKENVSQYPYLNNVYRNRLYAMQYQAERNECSRDSCLRLIVNELKDYIVDNKVLIDSLLCDSDFVSICKSPIDFPVKQYFYYLTLLKGSQETDSTIDSMMQIRDYNQDYMETLRDIFDNDFMDFSGI